MVVVGCGEKPLRTDEISGIDGNDDITSYSSYLQLLAT